ncbi:6509_t:CDS:2, partial [Entrophospora sp. SA101]
SGEDIVNAAKGLQGTSIANLNPSKRPKKANKPLSILEGITNWSYFTWPTDVSGHNTDGDLSGYICAHSLPNFGTWNTFSPFDIKKSLKDQELIKPNPSNNTKLRMDYSIKDPNRLSKDVVKAELKKRKIEYEEKEKKVDDIDKLKSFGIQTSGLDVMYLKFPELYLYHEIMSFKFPETIQA